MSSYRIIFVCTGNTCRSPMAQIMLKNMLKKAGVTGVMVKSAGICAVEGDKISTNARLALKKLGYPPTAHTAKLLTKKMLAGADAVICLTKGHKDSILKAGQFNNLCTVAELTGVNDILDPYGKELNHYITAGKEIERACQIILKKLKGEM